MLAILRNCAGAAALVACHVLSVVPVVAQDQEVLFEDDFTVLDAGFGDSSDQLRVEDGALVKSLPENMWWRAFYNSMVFDDIDVTIKVQMPDLTAEQGGGIGVMFWGTSADDMYVLEIGDAGTVSVRRFTPKRILFPVFWRTSDAVNTEPEAWNELRVVTHGAYATVYVNGQEIATFKGRPPAGGSLVGLFFETGEAAADEGRFSALKIATPEPGDEPPAEDASVLWADDFSQLEPGWGSEAEGFKVADGKLTITPSPDKAWTKFYEADVFDGDFEASVKVHVNRMAEGEFPMGSLIFWGTGFDDYWAYYLLPDGTIGVLHYTKERWLFPIKGKAVPADANFDPTGMTELKVVTEGRRATFFVNGVNVGTVSGMPPKDGSYFGFYNESAKSGGSSEYDDVLVKQR
jgi:hypothetical protein